MFTLVVVPVAQRNGRAKPIIYLASNRWGAAAQLREGGERFGRSRLKSIFGRHWQITVQSGTVARW